MKQGTRVFLVGLACSALPFALLTGSGVSPAQAQPVPLVAPAVLPAAATPVFNGWLTLNPVANSKWGSITATLTASANVKNRPVTLQSSGDAGVTWAPVAKLNAVKLDSAGKAVFKVTPDPALSYKAVASAYKYKVKKTSKTAVAVETHAKTLAEQWSLAFEDNFSGTDFNSAAWSRTYQDGVQGRWCSATQDSNGSVSGGVANLTMRRADAATTQIINDKTKVWQADAKKAAIAAANKLKGKAKAKALKAAKALPTNGCPKGVFGNARVSTEGDGKFHIKTGILAAEVSFPVGQGMHGGVWLQSNSDSEIDMVEAFGYRKGIQNVLHVGKYDTPEARKWVAKSTVNKKAWWSKPHLFSMEWTRSQVTFRVDGTVTKVEKKALPDAEYYLVLSMLSSDWETPRLTKPVNGGTKAKLPASMKVNWVKAWTPVA